VAQRGRQRDATLNDVVVPAQVEGLMRGERLALAHEVISLFAELLQERMAVLERASGVPAELSEATSTLLFASMRCADDLQELKTVREQLALKAGAAHAAAASAEATAVGSGVNERVVAYLSVQPPPPGLKLQRLEEIVREFGISEWDADAARGSILGAAPDLLPVAGGSAAWQEQPGPHMFQVAPDEAVASVEPPVLVGQQVDGFPVNHGAPQPQPSPPTPLPRAVPPLTPLPPAAAARKDEEYPDAETAARVAVRSAEKAHEAAAAAVRLAHAARGASSPLAPAAEAAAAAEVTGDDALAATLPSPPTAVPSAPANADDDDENEGGTGGGGGDDAAQLDELTRRFEELKRKL
jgi:hypothetical protein